MLSGSDARKGSYGPFLVTVVLLLMALVAPAASMYWGWSKSTQDFGAVTGEISTFTLSSSARVVSVSATLTPTWRTAVEVFAPRWDGLVTEVLVHPRDELKDGSAVARIDGVEVRYYSLDSPLYRAVCSGDSRQVAQIRQVLTAAGLDVGVAKTISWPDIRSIREYATQIGVQGASTSTCFEPWWIVSTQKPVGVISAVNLTQGTPAPSAGSAIIVGDAGVESISVRGTTGASILDDQLMSDKVQSFKSTDLLIEGLSIEVGLEDLQSEEALQTLSKALSKESEFTAASVEISLSDTQYVLPATSVISSLETVSCVEEAVTNRIIQVTVLGSSVTGVIVDFGGQTDMSMLNLRPSAISCE